MLVPVERSVPTLLCVDDNPSNLMAMGALVSGMEVEFVEAPSGAAAVELCKQRDFLVILLDVMMPEMDGLQAAKHIREIERAKFTPLIFVTAFPLDQIRLLQGYGLGAVDYIQKPIPAEILRSKIQVFIDLHKQQEALRRAQVREVKQALEAELLRKELEKQREVAHMSASYRLFVESVKDYAIFLIDVDGNILTWNPGVQRILGYGQEEITGLHFDKIFTKEDRERGIPGEELRNALVHERAEDTRWHIRKNGALFWADGVVIPLREDNELKGYAKLLRDRTEGKLAEEALLVGEERLRLATEATSLGTWDWNLLTQELTLSDRARDLFGITSNESVTYELLLEKVHPDDKELIQETFIRAKDHKNLGECRVEIRTKTLSDGSEKWLSVRGKVFFDTGQIPIRLLGTCWDISERKRMEADLRRSNAELERFANIASHDLQEPLRTQVTYLELLENRIRENRLGEITEYLKFARDGASRMRSLVQELLAYSHVGTNPLDKKNVRCEEVVQEVLSNLRTVIDESGARVTTDPLPEICADHIQLAQLFQNLIENAIKYREKESPKIHIGCSTREKEWIFCVRDNGIGIEKEETQVIFEPFRRLHSRSDRPGSGLGLSICRRIVERHGGTIWVESLPHKGSAFYFLIPNSPR